MLRNSKIQMLVVLVVGIRVWSDRLIAC